MALQPQPSATADLSATDITERTFSQARRGYEPEEVDDFLHQVAEQVSRLEGEVQWLRARTELLERRSALAQETAYSRIFRHLTQVIRSADEAAASIRTEAEVEAKVARANAREEAHRIAAEARREAVRIKVAARDAAAGQSWKATFERTARPGTASGPANGGQRGRSHLRPAPPGLEDLSGSGRSGSEGPPDELELHFDLSALELLDEPEASP